MLIKHIDFPLDLPGLKVAQLKMLPLETQKFI